MKLNTEEKPHKLYHLSLVLCAKTWRY